MVADSCSPLNAYRKLTNHPIGRRNWREIGFTYLVGPKYNQYVEIIQKITQLSILTYIIQSYSLSYMPPSLFNDCVTIYVRQQPQTKPEQNKLIRVEQQFFRHLSELLGSVNPSTVIEGWLA